MDARSAIGGKVYNCIGGIIIDECGGNLCTPSSINGERYFRPFIDSERMLIDKMSLL